MPKQGGKVILNNSKILGFLLRNLDLKVWIECDSRFIKMSDFSLLVGLIQRLVWFIFSLKAWSSPA